MDGAGVDKAALARALGSPASFGQSQYAFARGHSFEAQVRADGGGTLLRLLCGRLGLEPPAPGEVAVPDLGAPGPAGRSARTALELREAGARQGWTLLDHPMVSLEVAGAPAYLEPDALVVSPDGVVTVVEVKSFPILDGSADPAKVGAAARQAAVYVLALAAYAVRERVLLVCPRDFSNTPVADLLDVRPQLAVTRRQLGRQTRLDAVAAALPEDAVFDPARPGPELARAVSAVPAAYAPECLAACELAFHCRERAREGDEVTVLGRTARAELGTLRTVGAVLAAAESADGTDGAGGGAGAGEPAA
ncbi:nuclease-related domain-containing protein, partial [Streptomyces polyrhachis]